MTNTDGVFLLPGYDLESLAVRRSGAAMDCAAGLLDSVTDRMMMDDPVFSVPTRILRQWIGDEFAVATRRRFEEHGILEWTRPHKSAALDGPENAHAQEFRVNVDTDLPPMPYRIRTAAGRRRFRDRWADTSKLTDAARVQVEYLHRGVDLADVPGNVPLLHRRHLFRLHTGRFHASQDEQGRLYTPFTMLRKDLRRFVRIGGVETVKLDVKSACPFILAGMCRSDVGDTRGWRNYARDVSDGVLYERLMEASGTDDRSAVKTDVARLFNAVPMRRYSAVHDAFRSRYPSVFAWIEGWKAEHGIGLYSLLTPVESSVILPLVADLIREGIPVASIHDCIACDTSAESDVSMRMKQAFAGRLGGLTPSIQRDDD